jgi:hypothetical protein
MVKFIVIGIKIVSILILLKALYSVVGNIYMLKTGEPVKGKVISSYRESVQRTRSSSSSSVERPVIGYEFNGESFQFHGEIMGSIGANYEINEEVDMLLLKNNPSYSVVNSFLEMWMTPLLLIILSVVLFGLSMVLPQIIQLVSALMKSPV